MVDSIQTDFVSLNEDRSNSSKESFPSHQRSKVIITVASLVLSLLVERYCFIITVFKIQNYSYIAVFMVTALNCAINALLHFTLSKTQPRKLHEMFQIQRRPTVSLWLIGLIGALDMLYTFLLFWPATVLCGLLLVTLLQFFIPMNMLFRAIIG